MKKLGILKFVFQLLVITVIGCGGPSEPTLSSIHTKAIEYNQNGMKAAEKGEYERALGYYMKALKINRSIEHTEGIAVSLLNIAVIYQKLGNIKEANESIDMVFSVPDISDAVRSEAAFEKARLYVREKEFSRAKEWINKSLSLNKGIREGSRWNFLGRIAIIEGRYDDALNIANTALKLNRENKQRLEESNSLRLIAEISLQTGQYEKSREFYLQALQLDKELGDGKKIEKDLRGLAVLSVKQKRLVEAVNFYIRAYNVSKNDEDARAASETIDSLADEYRKSGDDKKADDILKMKGELEKK